MDPAKSILEAGSYVEHDRKNDSDISTAPPQTFIGGERSFGPQSPRFRNEATYLKSEGSSEVPIMSIRAHCPRP